MTYQQIIELHEGGEMPHPKKGESKSAYISRAVRYMIKVEGLSQDHALGKAYGMWKEYHGKRGKKK